MKIILITILTGTLIACASTQQKQTSVTQENIIQEEIVVSKNQEKTIEEKKKVVIEKAGISAVDVVEFIDEVTYPAAKGKTIEINKPEK